MLHRLNEISIDMFNEHFNNITSSQTLEVVKEWIQDEHLLNKSN